MSNVKQGKLTTHWETDGPRHNRQDYKNASEMITKCKGVTPVCINEDIAYGPARDYLRPVTDGEEEDGFIRIMVSPSLEEFGQFEVQVQYEGRSGTSRDGHHDVCMEGYNWLIQWTDDNLPEILAEIFSDDLTFVVNRDTALCEKAKVMAQVKITAKHTSRLKQTNTVKVTH